MTELNALVRLPLSPRFLATEHLVASKRGFDLGDDELLLARFEERAGELVEPDDWSFLGVLRWRAGRFLEAAAAFDRAGETPDAGRQLEAQLLAAVARHRAAPGADLAVFDTLEKQVSGGVDLKVRDIRLSRVDVLWLAGRQHEAEALLQRVQEETPEARADAWLELARLRLACDDFSNALVALDRATAADEYLSGAKEVRALALASLHRGADALAELETLLPHSDELRTWVGSDPRLACVRDVPRARELLIPPAPDASWLDAYPPVAKLRDDARVTALGITFVDEEERDCDEVSERYDDDSIPMGTLWTDELWAAAQEDSRGKVLVATGPAMTVRDGIGTTRPAHWYIAPDQPGTLYLALTDEVAPFLWIPVAATFEAVQDAVAEFFPPRRVPVYEQPKRFRAFMGFAHQLTVPSPYSGGLEQAFPHELDRYWVFNPYGDTFCWGTSCSDDPWPERIPPQPAYGLKITSYGREFRQMGSDPVCKITRRTKFSRSHVGYELHEQGLYVWDVRYTPSRHPQVIEAFNARFGYQLPVDLPFDVLGMMLGFQWDRAADLEPLLPALSHPGQLAAYVAVIAAIRHADPQLPEWLLPYAQHTDLGVRWRVALIGHYYRLEPLLRDMAEREQDDELRTWVQKLLDDGMPLPPVNEFGEPQSFEARRQ